MAEPPYLLDVTRAVADDVRRTLDGELGPQPPAELVDEVYAFGETLLRSLREERPERARRRLPVCAPGCDSCCRIHAVFVTPLEVLRIVAHLRATRTPDELAILTARVEALSPQVGALGREERARACVACPLLDEEGACSVHPVRPLLCRGYNSCDVDVCLRAFEARDPRVPLPSDVDQAAVFKSLFAALVLGADGRDSGPLELIHALRTALRAPDAEERWLAGARVFDPFEARVSRDEAEAWSEFIDREALPRPRGP